MAMKGWITGLAIAATVLPGAGVALAAPVEIRIAHETALESSKGQTWEYFKRLAEERLGDQVSVRHHHSGQLYGQQEAISALQAGAIQFIAPGSAILTGLYPKMALFDLPFLFQEEDVLRRVAADPEIGGKIFAEMPEKGLRFMAFWLNGHRMLGNTKRPVEKLEDIAGLKIRVPGGKIYRDTFQALGGNVVAVSWTEIVTALQQGTVDAIEPTPNNWHADKLYEIAPYITQTNHMLSTYVIATNAQWWDSLSEDLRTELQAIMDETTEYNWRVVGEENATALKEMAADGAQIIELSAEEQERWYEAAKPVHADYVDVIGQDLLDSLYAAIE